MIVYDMDPIKQARAELRDRFAMAALAVCLDRRDNYGHQSIPDAARHAYAVADAMLKARDAGKDEK